MQRLRAARRPVPRRVHNLRANDSVETAVETDPAAEERRLLIARELDERSQLLSVNMGRSDAMEALKAPPMPPFLVC